MEQKVKNAVKKMRELEMKLYAYKHASDMIYYDSNTSAPADSSEGRGNALAVLTEENYKALTEKSVGEMLDTILDNKDKVDFQTFKEAECMKEMYERESKVPLDEAVAYKRLVNEAEDVWHKAKAENDYKSFEGYLQKIFDTNKKFAGYYNSEKEPYDVLLDMFEKDISVKQLDEYFAGLKEKIVPLVKRIAESGREIDDSFLYQYYPKDKQKEFADYLMEIMGIDRKHCNIGETEHPYTLNFNKYDVRITTNYDEHNVASSMYSVIHEGGHALYELNTGNGIQYTCLAEGTSMGIHESQSRFYENIIGRSEEFISMIFPKMKELFGEQLKDVDAHKFYLAVNKVTPSLIRIDADELTYSLHIMVRYELEKQMIEGEITAEQLPEKWNELYKEYLGVDVPDDSKGVLQDSHWSGGSVGYFPSYSLGSAYGTQILESMKRDVDVWKNVSKGNLKPITEWLTEHIYKYGKMLSPKEVIDNCCGMEFDPQFYIDYLTEKYTKIYGL